MRVRSRSKAAGDEAYAGIPLYEAVPPAFVEPFPRALYDAVELCGHTSLIYTYLA